MNVLLVSKKNDRRDYDLVVLDELAYQYDVECIRLASIIDKGDVWGIGTCIEYDDSGACNATDVRYNYKRVFKSGTLGWKWLDSRAGFFVDKTKAEQACTPLSLGYDEVRNIDTGYGSCPYPNQHNMLKYNYKNWDEEIRKVEPNDKGQFFISNIKDKNFCYFNDA